MEPLPGDSSREVTRQSNSTARRRTALIVNDCPALHAMVRDVLASEYDCEVVATAEEAIAAASRRTPEVIISEVVMEGTDGYELCRRIRADRRLHEVPLILLTSNPDPDGRATGLEHGADDYLSAPLRPRELLARVRSLVRLREARQEVLRQNRALERAHDELLQVQRQLLETERLATLGTLATGLAHELNNPLAVVWAGFEQLSESIRHLAPSCSTPGGQAGEISEIGAEVRSGLERIRGIVQQLSMLAAPEEHRRTSVSVHAEIERAVAIAHARLDRVELKRRFEGPQAIQAAPGYLTQILAQVLINAADAVSSVPQPRIEIRTRRADSGLEIVVEDNGTGISAEVVPQIFDPFFTTKAAGQGTGLGLAVCQRFIQRLGGSAQVASQPGRGTHFRLYVPLEPPGVDSTLRPRRQPPETASS
jgi:C4-dicarboxylate-specific signal transduction histidine kinase